MVQLYFIGGHTKALKRSGFVKGEAESLVHLCKLHTRRTTPTIPTFLGSTLAGLVIRRYLRLPSVGTVGP